MDRAGIVADQLTPESALTRDAVKDYHRTPVAVQIYIFVAGLFYLVFGVLGLFPAFLYPPPARPEYMQVGIINARYGYLLDFLPTNLPHDIVFILLGVPAILASLFYGSSRFFARVIFVMTAMATMAGLLPWVDHLFGLMPLFSWNIPLHAVACVTAWYFGFIYPIDRRDRALDRHIGR